MARYIVVYSESPRHVPQYYVVDTATHSRIRAYDCEVRARHEADRLNYPEDSDGFVKSWIKTLVRR